MAICCLLIYNNLLRQWPRQPA